MADLNNRFIIETIANLTGLRNFTKEMSLTEKKSREFAGNLVKDANFVNGNVRTTFTKAGNEMKILTGVFEKEGQKIRVRVGQLGNTFGLIGSQVSELGEQSKKSQRPVGDFVKALRRVVVVVPIWFAFRRTAQLVFSTLRDGVKDIIAFDRALQKARRNLQGSSTEISNNFNTLKQEVKALSLETGESVETITNAFQKFATVGFDFETSLTGANFATKTAILLFGDAEETANAFARGMRVLVDQSDETKTAGEQISEAMALTAKLWETNAFEIGEFTESLEKFAGTAKTTNLTTQQTITLLATLSTGGLRTGRAGTLLRSSISKLLLNLDKLSKSLGVKVNPQLDSTFDVLLRVVRALEEFDQAGQIPAQATSAIADIFGGVRGAEPVRALVALREELEKNLGLTADLTEFEEKFKDVNDEIFALAKQIQNLNKELGRTLVVGITGGEDFRDSLERIRETQKGLLDDFRLFGIGLRETFNITRGLGELTFGLGTFDAEGIVKGAGRIKDAFTDAKKSVEQLEIEKVLKDLEANPDVIADKAFTEKFKKAIQKQLSFEETQSFITDIAIGKVGVNLTDKARREYGNTLANLLSSLKPIEVEQKASVNVLPQIQISDVNDIFEAIVSNQIDLLKLRGASNSELLKAESLLNEQLGIDESSLDILKRELDLEKAINEERRLRKDLSSETVKLFRIAQTEGTGVAQKIGELLAGQIDFNDFVRKGGQELEVFKQQFGDIFEQQQALQFFRGDRVSGASGLRGGGNVPIAEEQIRRTIPQFNAQAQIQAQRAIEKFRTIEANIQNRIDVRVEVSGLDASEIVKKVKDETVNAVVDEFRKPNSELDNILTDKFNIS